MSKAADVVDSVVDMLNCLGLQRMAIKLDELYSSSDFLCTDRLDLISEIVSAEYDEKASSKLARRLKKCHLLGSPEELSSCQDSAERTYSPTGAVGQLASMNFIRKGYNLLILGASDSGKTYFAKAIGIHACGEFRGEYWHCADLIDRLASLKKYEQPKYEKKMKTLSKLDFLIIDDFLISPLAGETETGILFSLLEYRSEARKSTVICSQRDPKGWVDMLSEDQVAADAISKRASRNYTVLIQKNN